MSLSIGILSWGAHLTLENSLSSYKSNGLFDLADEISIFFNKITNKDIVIARKYGLEYLGDAKNIGIGKALKVLVNQSRCDYFLFLENDWVLVENKEITERRIQTAIRLLNENMADVVRLRHRFKYGDPLYTAIFKEDEMESPGYLSDCIHWAKEPEKKFPQLISKISIDNEDWFFMSSKYACYTNNPCIYKKDFLETNVIPFAVGGGAALEDDIFPWWREQNFTIYQGAGLFEHKRLDRTNTSYFRFVIQAARFVGLRRAHLERIGVLKPRKIINPFGSPTESG
jgi:hypothetical protein